ncbi:MAG: hydrogenase expression/formation protein HypE [Candidatus Hydrogenedentota bacterium]|nr:MAG: hydrogenase expression/formation protein HypE [Candidatus Hydrogenedentota bacterium]
MSEEDLVPGGVVVRAHGGGGSAMADLLEGFVFPKILKKREEPLDDAAVWTEKLEPGARLAMTTDAYVVTPIFFPGGDLGRLAVCGTVNDLAVSGAVPRALSLALILEEGFELKKLERLMESAAEAAAEAGVSIVTGDTKVVERGAGNGCYAVSAGMGIVPPGRNLSIRRCSPEDRIIVTSFLGDHGTAVMAARNNVDVPKEVRSDVAPLTGLVEALLEAVPETRFLRDATRGGLSSVVCDLAREAEVGVELEEEEIPVRPETAAALSIFGIDPLATANEAVIVAVVPHDSAEKALDVLRGHPYGRNAAIIGRLSSENPGRVVLKTTVGGRRILTTPYGEELPRIC